MLVLWPFLDPNVMECYAAKNPRFKASSATMRVEVPRCIRRERMVQLRWHPRSNIGIRAIPPILGMRLDLSLATAGAFP